MIGGDDALLVVDVQRDFLPGGALAVPHGDEVVPVLAACIEAFAHKDLPIFASRDWHPSGHCSFRESGGPWPPHCVAGSDGAELDPELRLPAEATIVDKGELPERDAYSAFEGTDLDRKLRRAGVRRLYIGGLATEYCVLSSALDALRLGYQVTLLTDAIRPIDRKDGENAVQQLRTKKATLAESDDVLTGSVNANG